MRKLNDNYCERDIIFPKKKEKNFKCLVNSAGSNCHPRGPEINCFWVFSEKFIQQDGATMWWANGVLKVVYQCLYLQKNVFIFDYFIHISRFRSDPSLSVLYTYLLFMFISILASTTTFYNHFCPNCHRMTPICK